MIIGRMQETHPTTNQGASVSNTAIAASARPTRFVLWLLWLEVPVCCALYGFIATLARSGSGLRPDMADALRLAFPACAVVSAAAGVIAGAYTFSAARARRALARCGEPGAAATWLLRSAFTCYALSMGALQASALIGLLFAIITGSPKAIVPFSIVALLGWAVVPPRCTQLLSHVSDPIAPPAVRNP